MAQKHNIFHGKFIKTGETKMSPVEAIKPKFEAFVKSLELGQIADMFMEAHKDDGTLAQLAKIHVCIRELAKEQGEMFDKTKLDILKMSGLCFVVDYDGEKVLFCKSLAECSKEELSLVIESLIYAGDMVGINFR
jgi:hypothetical protein